MDAIALLCTLHAEGPTTLRRLRAHGCATLADLAALAPEDLAGLLDTTPAGARRFLREALGLAERLDEGELARAAAEGARTAPLPAMATARAGAGAPEPRDFEAGATGASLTRRERGLIGRVLERWRDADREPPAPLPASPTSASASSSTAIPPAPVRAGVAASATDALAAGALEGLDAAARAALREVGVTTLAELAAADEATLLAVDARGLRFTRASRLRWLAQRRLAAMRRTPSDSPSGAREAAPRVAVGVAPRVAVSLGSGAALERPRTEERFSAREGTLASAAETPALGAYELRPFRPARDGLRPEAAEVHERELPVAGAPFEERAIDDRDDGDAAGPFA